MNKKNAVIGIIDYGMGNLRNVKNAFEFLGINAFISNDLEQLNYADGLILPGVGAFYDAMISLRENNMDKFIKQKASCEKTPILGICLGMQVLFTAGYEVKYCKGLNLMNGIVIKFPPGLKIPHMGWNKLEIVKNSTLLKNIPGETFVYFVHSYFVTTETSQDTNKCHCIVKATSHYGHNFPAVVEKNNIFATQFHPEKSGKYGLEIINNFFKVVSTC